MTEADEVHSRPWTY